MTYQSLYEEALKIKADLDANQQTLDLFAEEILEGFFSISQLNRHG